MKCVNDLKPPCAIAPVFVALFVLCACHKNAVDNGRKDCGCHTDNFTPVKDRSGLLIRQNDTWVLASENTQFPAFTGFICNEDSKIVRDFIHGKQSDSLPVSFSGKESQICLRDHSVKPLSATYYAFNIRVDSLKIR